ncbi:MAG: YceD family protein [Gemmatimonas sp.]
MNKATIDQTDPWRATVQVTEIPETGLHRELEASPAVREALAKIAGLRDVSSAHGSFDLSLRSRGRVHVTGRVTARVGQTCVVTLEPIENDIDEEVDLIFAPEEQMAAVAAELAEGAAGGESEMAEPPEPIVNGTIDLGRLASDVLYLAIDPYPRKPGVIFEPRVAAADPEDHPFAALKALKAGPSKPTGGGSKNE